MLILPASPDRLYSQASMKALNLLCARVVLREKGYQGSTYVLRYDAREDRLVGTYSRGEGPPDTVVFVKESGL